MLLVITAITVLAFLILMFCVGKKLCDMAIKPVITKNYLRLIFTEKKKESIDEINKKNAQWIVENTQEIEIISKDGLKLKGYEIKATNKSNIWIIIVHGYMNQGVDMVQCAQYFRKFGYNSLIIDLRAHGKSEGKYIGMGWLDHFDLEIWIDKIINDNDEPNIILYGISMGAATVLMTTGENLPREVKMCIADCAYSSVWDEFKIHFNKIFHISSFPLLYIASFMSKIYAGYSFKNASTIKQVRKSKTPTLFIHGTEDNFVPFNMLNDIYTNANCKKQKLEIEDAQHGNSKDVNPEKYWKKIKEFIEQNIE